MNTEKSFEILHFSARKWPSYHKQGCYNLNLVFRVWDLDENSFTKQRFLTECEEWTERRVTTDIKLAEKYTQGLRLINANTGKDLLDDWKEYKEECAEQGIDPDMESSIPVDFVNDYGIKSEDVYITGYEQNWTNMMSYNKKFDVFRFWEFFEINPATKGIIQYINDLKEMKNPDTYYAEQLLRSLKALEFFWD